MLLEAVDGAEGTERMRMIMSLAAAEALAGAGSAVIKRGRECFRVLREKLGGPILTEYAHTSCARCTKGISILGKNRLLSVKSK